MVLQVCPSPVSGNTPSFSGLSESFGVVSARAPFSAQLEEKVLGHEIRAVEGCSCQEPYRANLIQSTIDGFYYCWHCLPENQLDYQSDD